MTAQSNAAARYGNVAKIAKKPSVTGGSGAGSTTPAGMTRARASQPRIGSTRYGFARCNTAAPPHRNATNASSVAKFGSDRWRATW
jgi:hypothetical protein